MTLRAITLRSPWAQCVALGEKTVENRGRNVGFRGEIAIHAGLAIDPTGVGDRRVREALGPDPAKACVFGAIVAVARLVDSHPAADPVPGSLTCCLPWGDLMYGSGPAVHLLLDDIVALERPVLARGSLPIGWPVPADVEEQVRAQLRGQP